MGEKITTATTRHSLSPHYRGFHFFLAVSILILTKVREKKKKLQLILYQLPQITDLTFLSLHHNFKNLFQDILDISCSLQYNLDFC